MQVGIIGLPNVGKSTIFNVITKANAEVANYPFCTIEPNTGVLNVPDPYLQDLAKVYNSDKVTPAAIKVLDVAGLVKGASKGEGLGNQFLSHIRAADILAHIIRCFADENVAGPAPDPAGDVDIINTELLLSDIETLTRRAEKLKSTARTGDREAAGQLDFINFLLEEFNQEKVPEPGKLSADRAACLSHLDLLSFKPMLYVANMDESSRSKSLYQKLSQKVGKENTVKVYAKLETELMELEPRERQQYAQELGIEGGLDCFIQSCYSMLNLITFYTINENEARAWALDKGRKAIDAAAKIHSDMEKGFIKAEVIGAEELLECGSFSKARESGRLRIEGRDYTVSDRDVIQIRFAI
ncbi:MAG: redox-regulated ATPase YchF [Actinomycetota bacterium]